eukprot:scaffold97_cov261-Pinguiococcus_pyrenoidosus.AAC.37
MLKAWSEAMPKTHVCREILEAGEQSAAQHWEGRRPAAPESGTATPGLSLQEPSNPTTGPPCPSGPPRRVAPVEIAAVSQETPAVVPPAPERPAHEPESSTALLETAAGMLVDVFSDVEQLDPVSLGDAAEFLDGRISTEREPMLQVFALLTLSSSETSEDVEANPESSRQLGNGGSDLSSMRKSPPEGTAKGAEVGEGLNMGVEVGVEEEATGGVADSRMRSPSSPADPIDIICDMLKSPMELTGIDRIDDSQLSQLQPPEVSSDNLYDLSEWRDSVAMPLWEPTVGGRWFLLCQEPEWLGPLTCSQLLMEIINVGLQRSKLQQVRVCRLEWIPHFYIFPDSSEEEEAEAAPEAAQGKLSATAFAPPHIMERFSKGLQTAWTEIDRWGSWKGPETLKQQRIHPLKLLKDSEAPRRFQVPSLPEDALHFLRELDRSRNMEDGTKASQSFEKFLSPRDVIGREKGGNHPKVPPAIVRPPHVVLDTLQVKNNANTDATAEKTFPATLQEEVYRGRGRVIQFTLGCILDADTLTCETELSSAAKANVKVSPSSSFSSRPFG